MTQLGKRLIFCFASVCVVLAILLFVPISFGTLRYLEVYPNGPEHSINLSRPEYLIPRELYTSGYPFLGGDFGFFDDPHFFATKPIKIEQVATSDDPETIYAQGFDINPAFSNQRIVEHLLAIEDGRGIHEILTPSLYFSNIVGEVFSLGFIDDQAAFLIPLEYGEQSSQKILLVSWPSRSETGIVITSDDRERWDSLLETLRGSQYVVVEHLCLSQQKSAHSFFRDITGGFCPDS